MERNIAMKLKKRKTKTQKFTSENIQGFFTEIAKLITSSLEIKKITATIMEQVELFFEPSNWSLLRVDPDTHELFFVIAKGIDIELVKNIRLKEGEGIAGQVVKTGKSIFVEDAQKDTHFSQKIDKASGFKTKSLIAVPIIFQEQVLGVIELINTFEDTSFTERDLRILETIADFAAIALTNAIAYERLSWIAKHDPLTSLYNRNRLKQLLNEYNLTAELDRQSDDVRAIIVGVDIDKFKEVNDYYGHLVGDDILVNTARLLQECCRETDFAFRVGGDEFLLVLLNIPLDEVATRMDHLNKQLLSDSRKIVPASGFSFGISMGMESDLPNLIKEADSQMYINKAKRNEKIL